MCGRFSAISDTSIYAELLNATTIIELGPRYNIAPSSDILAAKIAPWGERILEPMHWGLIPSWSKGPDPKYSMINARADTITDKPAYRSAFKKRRCLIPADGFYEWTQENGKQPYYIRRKDQVPFAFAGIWEHWDGPEGENIDSCSIITTDANSLMKPIHQRMPVILKPDQYNEWLQFELQNIDNLLDMLVPYPDDDFEAYKVSRTVNNARNEGPELIRKI